MLDAYFDTLGWTRVLVQRGMAAVYACAFVSARNQFPALLGERGLLPVPEYLARVPFRHAPSVFHWRYSDRLFALASWSGIALSIVELFGLPERGPSWLSFLVWFALWSLYLSIVNVGQEFYGFGWESMLLEAGFFTSFLGSSQDAAPAIPIVALRWMLFRTEFGAGLIKLRHDRCWRDLTCLYYHYETQPLPNPLSWHFHHLPKPIHRLGVLFSHLVQLVAPFGLCFPQPWAAGAGGLIVLHQLLLIISGNYAWLNWLTVVLGASALSDSVLHRLFGLPVWHLAPRSLANDLVLYGLAAVTLGLSVQPALNLISRRQAMNRSYNPLHLVNAYGAFGSVTRERFEIVIEACIDETGERWRELSFKGKPSDPQRRPALVAPYHLRLDWAMWFLALRGTLRIAPWFETLIGKLLAGDAQTQALLASSPSPEQRPRSIRALLYRYQFTDAAERAKSGAWWKRERVAELLRSSGKT